MATTRPARRAPAPGALTWGPTFDRALELAAEIGLDSAAFFDAAGERPRRTQRVPLDLLARFLTWAAEASGDRSFGLRLGARFHPSDLGAYGYLLLNAATLGEAMTLARRFAAFQQQGDAFTWKMTPEGHFEIYYDAGGLEERLRRQDTECTLAIMHAIVRQLVGGAVRPVAVRVQHARDGRALENHFGCGVTYCERDNALCYAVPRFDAPIRGADRKLLAILTQYVEQELEGLPPSADELGRIRWAIRRSLGTARLSLEQVAQQCRMEPRTLQRRLARHELTFSLLVDRVRQEVHAELGRSAPRSQSETASLLGFNDTSAFAKAKRRWKEQAGRISLARTR